MRKKNPRSGYVLLLVFAMAAIVAVTLYMQVPRVAFEAQRDKEELLQNRGHEYVRAITLFVHKYNRFPATMDELENTNNVRYLRRRYVDPMTGKPDWRLVHAGPGGILTDSITTQKTTTTTQQTFITEMKMFGAETEGGSAGINLAARRRDSDQAGGGGGGGNGSADNNVLSNSSNPPNPQAGNTGYNGPVMVLPDGTIVPATSNGQPGAAPGNSPPPGGFGAPGAPGASGAILPSGVAIQNNALNGQNNVPALPGQQQPPSGAAGIINQILTTPRPGGINGIPNSQGTSLTSAPATTTTTAAAGPQAVGAGLAGIASKREQEGIKTYNQRTKYNEWEFVYDISKDTTRNPQANGAAGGTGGQGRGGNNNTTAPSPFGQSSGPGTPPPPPGMTPGR